MMNCPKCKTDIDVDEDELEEGDPVSCDECGADLRVASTHPIELEQADADEDDDEDEDEDFDEDEDDEEEEFEEEDEDEDDEWS